MSHSIKSFRNSELTKRNGITASCAKYLCADPGVIVNNLILYNLHVFIASTGKLLVLVLFFDDFVSRWDRGIDLNRVVQLVTVLHISLF